MILVDTNVLLHYQSFDEVDWRIFASGEPILLAIIPNVLRELDNKKFSESPRVRDRAKKVLKKVAALVKKNDRSVSFREGCEILLFGHIPATEISKEGLDSGLTDDILVAVALKLAAGGGQVTVVSADLVVRLKANSLDVNATEPPDEWRLPDELTEAEKRLRSVESELHAFKTAAPDLRITFGGATILSVVVKPRPAMTSSEIAKKVQQLRKRHPAMDVPGVITDPTSGIEIDLGSVLDFSGSSRQAVRRYNASLGRFFTDYEAYLSALPNLYGPVQRTVTLEMALENCGTVSGEQVEITLEAHADGTWRRNPPKIAKPPRPPSVPEGTQLINAPQLFPLYHPAAVAARDNAEGPTFSNGDRAVVYDVRLVKPGHPVKLPTVYFLFASFEVVKPFKLSYTIVGKNLRVPTRGEIHVKATYEP